MPKLISDTLHELPTAVSHFRFSAIRPEKLDAHEYTLVSIVVDITSSVYDFRDDLLEAVKAIVKSSWENPRAENLLVRLLTFHTEREEIHGFKPLWDIEPDAYKRFYPGGMTALYDACYDAILASNAYAKTLLEQDFSVNTAIYVITDGCDNSSRFKPKHIAEQIRETRNMEQLESLFSVLIGINTGSRGINNALRKFKKAAGLDEYIDAGKATPERLAKLAAFVSHSISTRSRLLSEGSETQALSL